MTLSPVQVSCSTSTVQKPNGDFHTQELVTALCSDGTIHVLSNLNQGWRQLPSIRSDK